MQGNKVFPNNFLDVKIILPVVRFCHLLTHILLYRYGSGTLTKVFVNRVFQECLTYDGEMVSTLTDYFSVCIFDNDTKTVICTAVMIINFLKYYTKELLASKISGVVCTYLMFSTQC